MILALRMSQLAVGARIPSSGLGSKVLGPVLVVISKQQYVLRQIAYLMILGLSWALLSMKAQLVKNTPSYAGILESPPQKTHLTAPPPHMLSRNLNLRFTAQPGIVKDVQRHLGLARDLAAAVFVLRVWTVKDFSRESKADYRPPLLPVKHK